MSRDFAPTKMYMVMDNSKTPVRRYWTGHGWSTDPLMGTRSTHWYSDPSGHYWNLYFANCQAALVMLELSRIDGRTIIGDIRVIESAWYGERPTL